ncbi:hypothetical protein PGT21_016856 [Puccinia graminis f. sp. tritici]|uniref:Uncharacterized protein n=1 Tax=Puccinia graminis f. sp. tritici TaxID=56615 RepID=A0A5B0Q312_PUCGR|nr:hypothetical protein PGT21_016856 [Puccinia graminis f. sp. tritici]KAA1124688.1 hypothetical protein PGTUg99_029434 [Puccinia graminis f. sp. tritici]
MTTNSSSSSDSDSDSEPEHNKKNEICYDSEPERIKYFNENKNKNKSQQTTETTTTETTTATTATTATETQPTHGNHQQPQTIISSNSDTDSIEIQPVNRLTNLISKFRHQPTPKQSSSSHNSRKSSSSLSSVSSHKRRSTKPAAAEQDQEPPLSIDYSTLLRLNRCPACDNPWLTYKAPRSKLNHIQRCARQELIPPRHLTLRIENLLQNQDINKGLIDRHATHQNLQTSDLQNSDQPIQNAIVVPSTSSTSTSASASIENLEKSSPPPPPPPSSSKLTPKSEVFRSSTLKVLHQRTLDRNAQINTKNDQRSYSLWELASGDDDYPYDRSSAPSSPRSQRRVNTDRRRRTSDKGKKKLEDLSLSSSSSEDDDFDRLNNSDLFDQEEEQGYIEMPRYEQWTRSELENESERLGYSDGPELSTSALVSRAQTAWTHQMAYPPHNMEPVAQKFNTGRSDLMGLRDGSNSIGSHPVDQEDDDVDDEGGEQVGGLDEQADLDPYYQELEWENNLLNPQDHELFVESESVISPNPPVRPFFESFSKAKLELEYEKLVAQIQKALDLSTASSSPLQSLTDLPADLDKIPKTKPALVKKLLRLWDALYSPAHPSPSDDLVLHSSGSVLQPFNSSVTIRKEKLDLVGLNQRMILLFHSLDPQLYCRILRFEPIQLSVLEDKIKGLLEKEFEERFQAQLILHQTQQQQQQQQRREKDDGAEHEEDGLGSSLSDNSSDHKSDDDNDGDDDDLTDDPKKKKKQQKKKIKSTTTKKIKKKDHKVLTVTQFVLQIETLTRWLDLQAISYFLLDPQAPRKPRY